jgi:hypothetical protein
MNMIPMKKIILVLILLLLSLRAETKLPGLDTPMNARNFILVGPMNKELLGKPIASGFLPVRMGYPCFQGW